MFTQPSKSNRSHDFIVEESQKLNKMINVELLLKELDQVSYRGNGRWTALCPSCRKQNETLSVEQDPISKDGLVRGFSVFGTLSCTEMCSIGAVLAALELDDSMIFINGDLFEYSPEDYKCIMRGESAIVLLRDELKQVGEALRTSDIKTNEKRFINQINFVARGLYWTLRDGQYFLSSKNIDQSFDVEKEIF